MIGGGEGASSRPRCRGSRGAGRRRRGGASSARPTRDAARISSVPLPAVLHFLAGSRRARPRVRAGSRPRAGRGRWRAPGISSSPDAVRLAEAERPAGPSRALGAVPRSRSARPRRRRRSRRRAAPRRSREASLLGAWRSASSSSATKRGGTAGRVAGDRAGAAVERGRAVGRDRQAGAVAADRLADPQVEDRRAVQRVGADDEDRVGVVDVADPGRDPRVGEAAGASRGRARARCANRRAASRAPRA